MTFSSWILPQTLRGLSFFLFVTLSLAPVTQPHLCISFTLAPSGSLRVTLLWDSPLHLTVFPLVAQTCCHLSHLKKHVALLILCATLTAARLSPFLLSRQMYWFRYPELFFFSPVWTSSRLAVIPSAASDCPRPACRDCQLALCW